MTSRKAQLEELLMPLEPRYLALEDMSSRHKGHLPATHEGGTKETHFELVIVSAQFANQSRLARHRLVHSLLKEEWEAGLHALNIQTLTPEEFKGL